MYVSSVGLLDAVSKLEWKNESMGRIIHLTWDPPFSLDITGFDPDIWYCIEINAIPISCPDVFAVDETSFSNYTKMVKTSELKFRMDEYDDTSTSVRYEFRVTPINGAGAGVTSAPVTGYFRRRELLI